jgi:hypothetical protein
VSSGAGSQTAYQWSRPHGHPSEGQRARKQQVIRLLRKERILQRRIDSSVWSPVGRRCTLLAVEGRAVDFPGRGNRAIPRQKDHRLDQFSGGPAHGPDLQYPTMVVRLPLAFLLGLVINMISMMMTRYDGCLSLLLQPVMGALVTGLSLIVVCIFGSPLLFRRVWERWRHLWGISILLTVAEIVRGAEIALKAPAGRR